ncbi:hypothetical protein WJX81_008558 [Elliptochloris bilobata]|uniref:FO synthase n=1 Tax=Elliptochloris bilobata TaxID=381761 RepID=A0AAW1RFZ3_9CHLO
MSGCTDLEPKETDALVALDGPDMQPLLDAAGAVCDAGHRVITFSPKVFLPLTRLCRDTCGYCTFAQPPVPGRRAFMTLPEVLAVAARGAELGCTEALFTLGDKPEAVHPAAAAELIDMGHVSTLDYVTEAAGAVLAQTGLLPHVNAGVLSEADLLRLRHVSASQGLMLESTEPSLSETGGPHHACPDKVPAQRLATIDAAGRGAVPFTSGLLIGIGEGRRARLADLRLLLDLHRRHGHLQELIMQNFRAKRGTAMAGAPEPPLSELLWTVAVARLLFGPHMNIQAPPNLTPSAGWRALLAAGINDFGGISPLTRDFISPEAPWPHLEALAEATAASGKALVPRLAVFPEYVADPTRWLDGGGGRASPPLRPAAGSWAVAMGEDGLLVGAARPPADLAIQSLLAAVVDRGHELSEREVEQLFAARGADFDAVCSAADAMRARICGNKVTYVVNRNINNTNVCTFACAFCAFSKGRAGEELRDAPYLLLEAEIARRAAEAWDRGATEVCIQGGIHPDFTGQTYLRTLEAAKAGAPGIHVHAFSPLEVWHGAASLGWPLAHFLAALRDAGLGSLPGTAAEVLCDDVRAAICPDKLSSAQWLQVVEAAHEVGLRTTSTIMFGHMERPAAWARHLVRLRQLQARTGGITEFVPLPFVHMEAPIYLQGRARRGPTLRECVLMHALARLALPNIPNIQASWVKMGPERAAQLLACGANDMGGSLMNESITRAAGAGFGQELLPERMEALIRAAGRTPRQRTTLYGSPPVERTWRSLRTPPLQPLRRTVDAR